MASPLSPIGANVARAAANGLGLLAAWCCDHRRRVLLGWLLAVVAIVGRAAPLDRAGSGKLAIEQDLDHRAGGLASTEPVGVEAAGDRGGNDA
jgi:hypothetical protein